MSDLQEIRSELNTLDTSAGEVIEFFNDNEIDDCDVDDLKDLCDLVQELITTIQEKQGWI